MENKKFIGMYAMTESQREKVRRKYKVTTDKEFAKEFGCTHETVQKFRKQEGLKKYGTGDEDILFNQNKIKPWKSINGIVNKVL